MTLSVDSSLSNVVRLDVLSLETGDDTDKLLIQMFGMDVTFPENKGDKIWFYNKDEEDTASAKKLIIDGNGVAAEVIEQVGKPSRCSWSNSV